MIQCRREGREEQKEGRHGKKGGYSIDGQEGRHGKEEGGGYSIDGKEGKTRQGGKGEDIE